MRHQDSDSIKPTRINFLINSTAMKQNKYEQYKVQQFFSIEADIPTNSTICVKKSLEMLPKRSP